MPEMPDWKSLVEERLRTLRCETPAEPELTAELAQNLEDYYRELCSGGASEEEAYQRTLSELDDVYPLRAEVERATAWPNTMPCRPVTPGRAISSRISAGTLVTAGARFGSRRYSHSRPCCAWAWGLGRTPLSSPSLTPCSFIPCRPAIPRAW